MTKFKSKSKYVLFAIINLITFNCVSDYYQNKYTDIFISNLLFSHNASKYLLQMNKTRLEKLCSSPKFNEQNQKQMLLLAVY